MRPPEGKGLRDLLRVRATSELCLIHQDGLIRAMSEALARFLGYLRGEEWVGRPALELVHADDRPYIAERIENIYATGESTRPALQRLLRSDGKPVFVEIHAMPILIDGRVASLTYVKPARE
jgi:PAS domain S-box-containing protein